MQRLALALFGAVILAGCATTPTPIAQAKMAPPSRVSAFQERADAASATLALTRDQGFLGSGCYYAFWINSVLAARLDVGETASFFLSPGEHLLKVGRDPLGQGLCGADSDNWTQRETILRPNEKKHFRLSIDEGGKLDIQRSE